MRVRLVGRMSSLSHLWPVGSGESVAASAGRGMDRQGRGSLGILLVSKTGLGDSLSSKTENGRRGASGPPPRFITRSANKSFERRESRVMMVAQWEKLVALLLHTGFLRISLSRCIW